jgi:outer membrane protein
VATRTLTLAAIAASVVFGVTPSLEAQGNLRIGYIDSRAILAEAPGAAEAQAEFDRQMQNYNMELEQLGADLDSMVTAYQQQQSTLLPNVRQARENEIRQTELRYQQRVAQMEQESESNRAALIEPILTEMMEVIEQIRTEGSYSMIMDAAGQSIIAADPTLDLTQEVLRRLGQTAGAGSTTPAPAATGTVPAAPQ